MKGACVVKAVAFQRLAAALCGGRREGSEEEVEETRQLVSEGLVTLVGMRALWT